MVEGAVRSPTQQRQRDATNEQRLVRLALIGATGAILALFLLLPLAAVFVEAFSRGFGGFLAALSDPDTLASIKLTLIVAGVCVPINVIFGMAAAWGVARFEFVGKSVLVTLIDLPFSVSPVVVGLAYVLLFGSDGLLGAWLARHGVAIIFAIPGIILVTTFVTFPFVARELIPLMQHQGSDDEQAALTLGASAWKMFATVTLPNIKWGLLYGVLLCNARAMGEFGAVSVVSGHIRGLTNTMPLQVEALYNDYDMTSAFAVAFLLAMLALVTLVAKTLLEWRFANALAVRRKG